MFSEDDRVLIKVLRQDKGYNVWTLLSEFPHKNWSRPALYRLIAQIDATGSAVKKQGSGRSRTGRSNDNIADVEELVLSQENAPCTHKTVRQIARETGIDKSSVHRIIHKDLQLVCFKKKRAQELTAANKLTRLVRAKQLLKKYPASVVSFIWFTDEKLFTVAPPINLQNDRLYAPVGTKKRQLSADRLLHTRSNFSKSVTVSVGVSGLGCRCSFLLSQASR